MTKTFTNNKEWALILGGSSGLGLASAKKLASEGLNICIVHRDRKSVMERIRIDFAAIEAMGVELLTFNVDALRQEKRDGVIETLKQQFGKINKIKAVIFSIAKGNLKPMQSSDGPVLKNDDFHLTIEAMAIGVYDWTQQLIQEKLLAADTRIISFTSEGNQRAWYNYAAVSAAKASLEAITRSMALEYAPLGIRANCVQAGVTDTESLRMIPGSETLKGHSLLRNPFGRLTQPEDVANVVYLLCREEAAWINGAVIPADGGERIR